MAASAPARRPSAVIAGVTLVAFLVVALSFVPWDWVPGGRLEPVAAGELLTRAELDRAEAYSSAQRHLSYGSLALSTVVALVLGLTPLGARLVAALRGPWWGRVALGTALLLLAGVVVTLPVRLLLRDNAVEAGLSTQSLASWTRDLAVSFALSWVYAVLVVLLVVGTARRLPRLWPLVAGAVAAVVVVVGSWVYPVAVEPLFNDFEPLPDGALRTGVLELADREGVPVDQVLVADASRRTTTLNAYVSGLGSTRRVVLYDTLVRDVPRAEALSVVAHELAHAERHDVELGTALAALGVGFGIGVLGLLLGSGRLLRGTRAGGAHRPEAAALVLALVATGTLLASPVENAVSRAMEARADRGALLATGDAAAFEAMQVRLSTRSLADPDPPWLHHQWFGSHPTLVQRVGIARGMPDQRWDADTPGPEGTGRAGQRRTTPAHACGAQPQPCSPPSTRVRGHAGVGGVRPPGS